MDIGVAPLQVEPKRVGLVVWEVDDVAGGSDPGPDDGWVEEAGVFAGNRDVDVEGDYIKVFVDVTLEDSLRSLLSPVQFILVGEMSATYSIVCLPARQLIFVCFGVILQGCRPYIHATRSNCHSTETQAKLPSDVRHQPTTTVSPIPSPHP
jgi:hypothetical protein